MKEDVAALPASVPRKRKQIEALLDLHIAMWLADDTLSRGDRLRLEAEKERRKLAAKVDARRVGVLVSPYGMPPEQLSGMIEAVKTSGASEIHHGGVTSKLHNVCRVIGVVHHNDTAWRFAPERDKEVIRASDAIIAAPKEASEPTGPKEGVWHLVKYAKHRGLPVKVVFPDGTIKEQ